MGVLLGVLSIAIEKVQVDLKELKMFTLFQYEARIAILSFGICLIFAKLSFRMVSRVYGYDYIALGVSACSS